MDYINKLNLTESIKSRLDLTNLPFITIDGENAKDFDDAVYVKKTNTSGYKLYVAIADVSFFVSKSSSLDTEAKNRGTSVYFPDQVVPMLPELLSNNLCSLVPQQERLSLVCIINFDNKGIVRGYKFQECVIKSHSRQTYNSINSYLLNDKTAEEINLPKECISSIQEAKKLADLLINKRKKSWC